MGTPPAASWRYCSGVGGGTATVQVLPWPLPLRPAPAPVVKKVTPKKKKITCLVPPRLQNNKLIKELFDLRKAG